MMRHRWKAVVNKMVGVTPETDQLLREIAFRCGVTQTQIMREGIDMAIQKHTAHLTRHEKCEEN